MLCALFIRREEDPCYALYKEGGRAAKGKKKKKRAERTEAETEKERKKEGKREQRIRPLSGSMKHSYQTAKKA